MDIVKKLQALGKAERYEIFRVVQTAKGGVISADELRQNFPQIAPGTLWAQLEVLVKAGLINRVVAGRYAAKPEELKPLITGVLAAFGRGEIEATQITEAAEKGG